MPIMGIHKLLFWHSSDFVFGPSAYHSSLTADASQLCYTWQLSWTCGLLPVLSIVHQKQKNSKEERKMENLVREISNVIDVRNFSD